MHGLERRRRKAAAEGEDQRQADRDRLDEALAPYTRDEADDDAARTALGDLRDSRRATRPIRLAHQRDDRRPTR